VIRVLFGHRLLILVAALAATVTWAAPGASRAATPQARAAAFTPGAGIVGEPLSLSVRISNVGAVPAPGLGVVISFSAEASFRSSDGSCRGSGRTVTCTLGDIGPGGSKTIVVIVIPRAVGALTTHTEVTSPSGAQVAADNASVDVQPRPVVGKTFNVATLTGPVGVRTPAGSIYRRLLGGRTVPVGSFVDARRARVRVSSGSGRGRLQKAQFAEGLFVVRQARSVTPVTELVAAGGDFSVCGALNGLEPIGVMAVRRPIRRVWGSGKGRFRTTGRYAAATTRGTVWLTEDRCNGTLIYVRTGTVLVTDLVRHVTIIVRAGHSRFVPAPGPG
jgi:hypothetical protein